jgi:hypothetical protein
LEFKILNTTQQTTTMNVIFEALLVGLLTVFCGSIVSAIVRFASQRKDGKQNSKWTVIALMEVSLFLTGVFIHLGCEVTGLNKKYCDSKR